MTITEAERALAVEELSNETEVLADGNVPGSDELDRHKSWEKDRRYKPRLMSRWLSPTQLASVGLKERIAGTFESFADRRETLAQREPVVMMHPSLPNSDGPGRRLLFENSWAREAREDLWIDYVADVGDGFSSTYTVAAAIAMTETAGEKERDYDVDPVAAASATDWGEDDCDALRATQMRRGELLVMGGDQVYPLASDTEYRNRTVGPYETACRKVDVEPMGLLAVPGNHDWYDGLTAFLSRFCSEGWIGAWQTRQTRSYWAAKLQEGWWIWGIDIGLEHTPIDYHQLEYFRMAAKDLVDGDQIILVTSKPSWVQLEPSFSPARRIARWLAEHVTRSGASSPEDYDQLTYFMSTTLQAYQASSGFGTPPRFAVVLSGDKHYYCRYDRDPSDTNEAAIPHVIAGGGGAYLSLPFGLVERLRLPTRWRPEADDHVELVKAQQWPHVKATKRIGWHSLYRTVTRNWGICAVLALFHLGLAATLGFGNFTTSVGGNLSLMASEITSNRWWVVVLAALVGVGTVQMTFSWVGRFAVALNIVGAQLVALAGAGALTVFAVDDGAGIAATTWATIAVGVATVSWLGWGARMWFYFAHWPRAAKIWAAALALATVAGYFLLPESAAWLLILGGLASVFGGVAFAVSMLIAASFFGVHDNMISVTVRDSGYKNFLRLHIDADGDLVVYAIGFERVPHQRLKWRTKYTDVTSNGTPGGTTERTEVVTPQVTRGFLPLQERLERRPERYEPRIIDTFRVSANR